MNLLNLKIQKFNSAEYSVVDWQQYFTKILANNSLHEVLATSTCDIVYLCEVAHEIKKVKVELGKYYDNLKVKPDLGNYEDVDWDSLTDEVKQESLIHGVYGYHIWGHGDLDIKCHSFKDVTVVWDMNNDTYDFYKTEEVLKVLDQWIEYLKKFNAEKNN
jgi:hypothetical protein